MTRSSAGARRRFAAIGLGAPVAVAVAGLGLAVHAFAAADGAPPRAAMTGSQAATPSLTVHVLPGRRRVAAGTSVTYRVRIGRGRSLVRPPGHGDRRGRLAARVSLRMLAPLPAGFSATFRPAATRTTSVMLTVRARARVRPGTYRLRLAAKGRLGLAPRHRMAHAGTTLTIVVAASPSTFTVAVTPAGLLAPGRGLPLDLILTNPDARALQVGRLAVAVAGVTAPEADTAHPCTTGDFSLVPFSGAYGFTLPGRTTTRLSTLGIPAAQWPLLAMTDSPVNQDGCKHAKLTLSFADR
ncbi:MAG: hypothetical protein QOE31_55 [Solirubrobacteraceae bacterium]|nr:hypothetical protein [Solirubrobacteraceae bacterium]